MTEHCQWWSIIAHSVSKWQKNGMLPHIDDLFEQLTCVGVFPSLDLAQGYHHIDISKEGAPKTAFKTPFEH
jgi:hypothetical protein